MHAYKTLSICSTINLLKLPVVKCIISSVWHQIGCDSGFMSIFFLIYIIKNLKQSEAFSIFRIAEPACIHINYLLDNFCISQEKLTYNKKTAKQIKKTQ